MATHAKKTSKVGDRGRVPYRFTAKQAIAMAEGGILVGKTELWDGVIYRMTKGEIHNVLVNLIAQLFIPIAPAGYHVRQESSIQADEFSLPEPDVEVIRGRLRDFLPDVPTLDNAALLVEVSHNTLKADSGVKLHRYAAARVPVYWIVRVALKIVSVYESPRGEGEAADYATRRDYKAGEEIPFVIDGAEVGRVAVSELFTPEPPVEGARP